MSRRVVVTGMGALTAIGNSVSEYWDGLLAGKSGGCPISYFDTEGYTTRIAAELKGFSTEGIIEHKDARKMDRYTQYAVAAAQEAMDDCGLDMEKMDPYQVGVIVGSGIGGIHTFEVEHEKLRSRGPRRVSPFFIPQMIADIAPGWISIRFGLKGPNYATVSACATSNHAIGDAFRTIKYGDADVMVTGGSEYAITPISIAGFSNMKAMTTRNDDPARASRPFDKERDGFLLGEGAGIVVLEELEHAKKRGAKIYGEIRGIGFTADAYHLTAPVPGHVGAVEAMKRCLKDGGLNAEDIDYVNAHGTSTPYNDLNETMAIKSVFGDHANQMNVSSTKSMTGHLLGAAGAIELIAGLLSMQHNIVPPTINYEVPDPECDLNYTPNTPQEREVNAVVSNTFGFGGHNACISIGKYQ